MDQQAYQAGRTAYMNGDYAMAVTMLSAAKNPGEIYGAADHMRGNALMKLGRYEEAAEAYASALEDHSYGKAGALNTNRGRALAAAGQDGAAIAALTAAMADSSYTNQYKTKIALGKIYERQGQMREAGAAYRAAAIDENNPDPAVALLSLGRCFMELGRPVDAVEAYRTALDFSAPQTSQAQIYALLGEAFVAASRMQEALDAFNHATQDGSYNLTPAQRASYTAAQNAVAALTGQRGGETDAMLAAAGYGGSGAIDPLDPLGKSGEFIPSPEDTGFFEVSEQDLVAAEKKQAEQSRKKKHTGLKVAIIILVVLAVVGGGLGFAYWRGYGWPMAEDTVNELFYAKTDGTDAAAYLAPSLSDDQKKSIEAILPSNAQLKIDGIDRSTNSTTVACTATLPEGGSQAYTITLVRDGLGWKVSDVQLSFDSQSSATSGTTTTTGTVSTGSDASSDTGSTGTSDTSTAGSNAATPTN